MHDFRARLTVPPTLEAVDMEDGSVAVIASEPIPSKTRFGPYEAKRVVHTQVPDDAFLLKVGVIFGSAVKTTDVFVQK